ALLRFFADVRQLGRIRYEPFQMKTAPDLPGRSPDILFVAEANLPRLHRTHLEGPADLAVEIISPKSRARDRGEKFYEYEQGGVREYWMIDPLRKQAEFYGRDTSGIYRPIATEENGIFRSEVLRPLWLRTEWLWRSPPPEL